MVFLKSEEYIPSCASYMTQIALGEGGGWGGINTNANTTFMSGHEGAIDYVCVSGQNGGTMVWNPGTLKMSSIKLITSFDHTMNLHRADVT